MLVNQLLQSWQTLSPWREHEQRANVPLPSLYGCGALRTLGCSSAEVINYSYLISTSPGAAGLARVGKSRQRWVENRVSLAVLDPITRESGTELLRAGIIRSTPLAVDRPRQLRVSPWAFEALARDLMTVSLQLRGLRAELNWIELSTTATSCQWPSSPTRRPPFRVLHVSPQKSSS